MRATDLCECVSFQEECLDSDRTRVRLHLGGAGGAPADGDPADRHHDAILSHDLAKISSDNWGSSFIFLFVIKIRAWTPQLTNQSDLDE